MSMRPMRPDAPAIAIFMSLPAGLPANVPLATK